MPTLFWRMLSSILWLRPRLGTHFCFNLVSLGAFSALFSPLRSLWGQFSAILERPDHRKTTNFIERVVKITLFVVFASGAALGLSWGLLGLSWGALGHILRLSWGLLGPSWGHLGDFLGASWRFPGCLLGLLGGILCPRAA